MTVSEMKTGAPARSAARLAAVQALYQMETTALGVEATIREFNDFRLRGDLDGEKVHLADKPLFASILRGVVESQGRLDGYLQKQLATGWKLKRIDPIARAILRAGLFEMIRRPEIPFRVIIDEYLDVANAFFDGDERKFINGVLDAAAKASRSEEIALNGRI